MAPLFTYWEQHKHLSVFDTIIDFTDQGFGLIDNFYNFIYAGHLFSDTQTHVLLLYDIAVKDYSPLARILIYKRNMATAQWHKVFDDTLNNPNCYFKNKDWNGDGIRDFSYMYTSWHTGRGPITWYLWLIDKKGMPHKVKGFEEIDDPQIDIFTHHIFSNEEGMQQETMAEYIFSADSMKKISDDMVVDYNYPNVVTYYRDGELIRKVTMKSWQRVYTPIHRNDVDADDNIFH